MRNARKRGALLTLALAAALLAPAAAHAGTYNVYSCSIDGGFFGNGAWEVRNTFPGDARYPTDGSCTQAGDPLVAQLAANNAFPSVSYSGLWFFAPSGTTISDFEVVLHHYWYAPPLSGYPTERTYTLASYGDVFYSGTGLFRQTDQDALAAEVPPRWYGYRGSHQSGAADTGVITMTRSSTKRASAAPQPTYMTISAGCFTDDNSDCSLGPGTAKLELYGSRITISDSSAPALDGPRAGQGLRTSGTRSGSEPVTFSASDNVGIRKAELVDVTDAADPTVVASKDFNATPTVQKTRCNFTQPLPCPNLSNETLAANPPIAGHRSLLVRVTDSAGNQTVSAPFPVYARGSANGANAGDGAKLIAGFPAKVYRRSKAGKRYYTYVLRPSRTVSYGKSGTLRGTLRNADGQPITGADVRVLVRENRTGAQYVDRGGITSDASGRISLGIPAGSSRTYQLTYKAFVGDDNLAARSKSTLNTRARITVSASRRVRSRGSARFHGTLVGRPLPRRGVTLELQAFQPHRGWRTVGTVRTGKGGRYSVRYRFNSGGGSFRFRVRLRPNDAYPYTRASSRRLRVRVG